MKKISVLLGTVLSLFIFVATFSSCEKETEVLEAEQKTEITTMDDLMATIGNRIISVTEDHEEPNGMRGTLYLFETNVGEQEIFVPNKVQDKGLGGWIYSTGTLYLDPLNNTVICANENRNCYVLFGKIHTKDL